MSLDRTKSLVGQLADSDAELDYWLAELEFVASRINTSLTNSKVAKSGQNVIVYRLLEDLKEDLVRK